MGDNQKATSKTPQGAPELDLTAMKVVMHANAVNVGLNPNDCVLIFQAKVPGSDQVLESVALFMNPSMAKHLGVLLTHVISKMEKDTGKKLPDVLISEEKGK